MAKRGVWALRELTLHYCKNGGSSRGVRHFIETGLADFARQNPQIQCRTQKKMSLLMKLGLFAAMNKPA